MGQKFSKRKSDDEGTSFQAIELGIRDSDCVENGYGILATGEMGIGNTTTSSAVASVLLNGPGGGRSDRTRCRTDK